MTATLAASLCVIGILFPSILCSPIISLLAGRGSGDEIAESKEIAAGHSIELKCEASGPTPPIIHWRKDGMLIQQGPLDRNTQNMMAPVNPGERGATESLFSHEYNSIATLVIKDAQPEDSGKYTCVADLPEERTTKNFDITVLASLKQHGQAYKRSDEDEKARIYLYTDEVFEFEGVSTLLICRATQGITKAAPVIRWTVDDAVITDQTPGFHIRSNGDLVIDSTSDKLHMANIKCTAMGDNGTVDEKNPFIYIYAPQL